MKPNSKQITIAMPMDFLAGGGHDVDGGRYDEYEHDRELEADPTGDRQASESAQGLGDDSAKEDFHPVADHLHVVGEPRHQFGRAPLLDLTKILMDGLVVKEIAQIEDRAVSDRADGVFLPVFENPFDRDG